MSLMLKLQHSAMCGDKVEKRMHSSRTRTVRCSGCLGGACLPRRGCLPRGGVSAQSGVAAQRGVAALRDVVHPPGNRITDRCKTITFLQLLLWTVIITDRDEQNKSYFFIRINFRELLTSKNQRIILNT